jgi:DNA-binding response OmpR family regulator
MRPGVSSREQVTVTDVLLIDDEPGVTRSFPGWLRKAGFACRTAESPRQALEAAAAEWPDVILLDLHLADEKLDGWQVWDELDRTAAGRPLRVIVTSAAVDSADQEEVRRRGGRAVRKTAGKEKMVAAIRAALARLPAAGPRPKDNPAARARILIVEDEAALAASYQRGLEAADYRTQSVAQGEEALVAFRAFGPDLVLLDL